MTKIQIRNVESNIVLQEIDTLDTLVPVAINDATKHMDMYSNIAIYSYMVVIPDQLKHLLNINENVPF